MSVLPPGATEASRMRYQLAHELAQRCPLLLGQEIALTGSAARGVADEKSDIELNFWVDLLPSAADRAEWLRAMGATDVTLDAEAITGGSIWATCCFGGVWVEAGWQTITALNEALRAILAGEVTDHDRLTLASTVAHAVSLRSTGLLAQWQQELSHYPDAVQRRLIAAATEPWMFPHVVDVRWALIRRDDRLALAERLVWDLHNVLRIVFAMNRQWEPDWKWIEPAIRSLTIKPERLVECLNGVFSTPEPEQSVAACMELILDALALVSPPHDVTRAHTAIREGLRANLP